MERRRFIKTTAAMGVMAGVPLGCATRAPQKDHISGFIFSDAHIGWNGKDQPTRAVQREMIGVIKKRFPDLDLVFDTGDVHHGSLKEPQRVSARAFWLDHMAGQFPESLLFYVAGNHELGRGINDAEKTACKLGSLSFRPYYSFDYKGIHFIALPQLLDTILISEEAVNWLRDDLSLNAGKTTLVFSHNSLSGTTYTNGESGYRETVNSAEIVELLDNHGHVLGWFHGHNHQYEVVAKDHRLYVSNGRIGGFNPPQKWGDFGQGHLGGIYFRVDAKGVHVRAFSATENRFFDELGSHHLSHSLQQRTSFDPRAAMNHYFGHGKLADSVPYRLHNHHLNEQGCQLMVSASGDQTLNENSGFRYPTEFFFAGRTVNRVIGFQVRPGKVKYAVRDGGLVIEPFADSRDVELRFPVEKYRHQNHLARSGYYRCAPGMKMKLLAEVQSGDGQPAISFRYKIMNAAHQVVHQQAPEPLNIDASGQVSQSFRLPEQIDGIQPDESLYLFIRLSFAGQSALQFRQLALHQDQYDGPEQPVELLINGQTVGAQQAGFLTHRTQDLFPQGSATVAVHKSRQVHSLMVKQAKIKWQVRNATATWQDNALVVHRLRHHFQQNPQVILVPTSPRAVHLSELFNIRHCVIRYDHKQLQIELHDATEGAELVVLKTVDSVRFTGAQVVSQTERQLRLRPSGTIIILQW